MYVYYFVQVGKGFGEVEPRLHSFFSRFNHWAEAAYREGEELRTTIGPGSDPSVVAKTVRFWVGEPARIDDSTSVPILWEATGATGLFPKLTADLTVAPLGPDITQLEIRGNYEPPLGALGRALDRALLHRIAEASVKGFLDRIATAITTADGAL